MWQKERSEFRGKENGSSMESKIAKALQMQDSPVALIWADRKPEKAMQFQEGKWGCVMWLVANAARGKSAVADARTFGCFGGGVGLGFGEQYKNFPGGEDCFCHFLSTGNEKWEKGRQVAEKVKPFMRSEAYDDFLLGERYLKSPELVRKFVELWPITEIPTPYVLFKPLADLHSDTEKPEVVIFFVQPDQFSALVVLANYGREDNENVVMPYAAGCQSIGIYPYREAKAEKPRAVAGLIDLSARLQVRKQMGKNVFTFAVPFSMFQEMEGNVEGSFLERHTWLALRDKD
jgi:uncharacterized protein (DUF169 family)